VPLTHAALMRAMELNGVQVDNNKAAFEWGRRCAHDLAAVQALFQAAQVIQFVKKPSLAEMVAKRVEFLTGYQNAAYAAEYQAFVDKVRAAEPLGQARACRGRGALPVQADGLQGRVRGGAPAHRPGLHQRSRACSRATTSSCTTWRRRSAAKDEQGELVKKSYGPGCARPWACWRLKGLRGTALDPSAAPRSAAPSAP
jgi:indolepyruvate ferredoxin oxidoreductase